MTRVLVEEREDGARAWTMRLDDSATDVDGSESPDLGEEWRSWRVDDPQLESDETADEGVKKKMKKNWKRVEFRNEMSTDPGDG